MESQNMAPDCANAEILALQMAQIFSVRDDFNFARLTLMGKDTQTVLWFISVTIYQSCFLQKYLRSSKNSQDSCSHSAIYNPFTRRLGFVFFNHRLLQNGLEDCNVSSLKFIFRSCTQSPFFPSCFSSPRSCHPSLSSFSSS